MGNCFKTQSADDITLLHDNDNPEGPQQTAPVPVGPPPPYQVNIYFHPTYTLHHTRDFWCFEIKDAFLYHFFVNEKVIKDWVFLSYVSLLFIFSSSPVSSADLDNKEIGDLFIDK